ncbi:MAG: nuclear transport factor 2 family protein [Bdellovibrionota bacterium]
MREAAGRSNGTAPAPQSEADYAAWVKLFAEFWRTPKENLHLFREMMDPEIRLLAPGTRPTKGWEEGIAGFERLLAALPDMTGKITRWSATGETLFIEMTFAATVGGKKTEWKNVDRFLFRGAKAVERVAYFNPLKLYAAFLMSPSGIRQFLRLRRG